MKYIRAKQIAKDKSYISVSTVFRRVQAGILSKSIKIMSRIKVWTTKDIDNGIEKHAVEQK
jgi:predicted DNA-binding transcriptional regulator AlpA